MFSIKEHYKQHKSFPITTWQILDSSKLKQFADDNFKFDENGRKLSKKVENTVGKGEIARYEQFLLFPQCLQKACFQEVSLCGNGLRKNVPGDIFWDRIKMLVTTA